MSVRTAGIDIGSGAVKSVLFEDGRWVAKRCERIRRRDPMELLPESLPDPITVASQRDFVRKVLAAEVDLRAKGADFVPKAQESEASQRYRDELNAKGSPSDTVAAGYKWTPGTELQRKAA